MSNKKIPSTPIEGKFKNSIPMQSISENKSKKNNLSKKVFLKLQKKGYSHLFNLSDFSYYKQIVRNSVDKVSDIVELFIFEDNQNKCDFDDYVW